jgi:single-stranded-DNA-specific exonuclease
MDKKWINEPQYTNLQLVSLHTELLKYAKSTSGENYSAYLILAKLLLQRGIFSVQEAVEFNQLSNKYLHDPFLMLNMTKAVDRILLALDKNEKIMVYGDYDVDGTTSVALMTAYLSSLTSSITYYIPDRYTEGYGISIKGIDSAKKQNAPLIIALDCGIKAIDQIDYANKIGVDFIICDHHTPGELVPNAIAVLDPKQFDCSYPYKELSGCGIGYKLCQAIHKSLDNSSFDLSSLLDLVAISTACDIVPITGENRVLASLGLAKINNKPRASITAILGEKKMHQKYTISDLVFQAGPKINAAGRISSGKTAVDLLLASKEQEILEFAEEIETFNNQRKDKDKQITEEALKQIHDNPSIANENSTVLYDPNWHKGVVGIVASRVIEKHYKPTIILTDSKGDVIGGSVRSVKGFDVYKALEQCADEIIQFGGHKYAAGLTLKKERLQAFRAKFEEAVSAQMEIDSFNPSIKYDAIIELSDITMQLKAFLDKLAPFGPQNMTPTFRTNNVVSTANSRNVGADKSHLKLEVTDPNTKKVIQGIAFSLGHLESEIVAGNPIDIIYNIDINYWRNTQNLQLMVKDIQFTGKK